MRSSPQATSVTLILDRLTQTQSTSTMVADVSLLKSSLIPASPATTTRDPKECSLTNAATNPNQPINKNIVMRLEQRQVTRVCAWDKRLCGILIYQGMSKYTRSVQQAVSTSNSSCGSDETVWAFIPSFLSRCIEFRLRNDYGRISRSLTSYAVVGRNSSIFVACRTGNMDLLRSALSDEGMTPFVVGQNGDTLLHVIPHVTSSVSSPVSSFSSRKLHGTVTPKSANTYSNEG